MSTKPRSDSALKTLPENRQADIAEHLKTHSLADTAKWLAEDGFKTSSRALSEFGSWYALRSQLSRNEQTVETLLADYVKANPDLPPEKIQAMGQAFFSAMSLAQQDPESWVQIQRLNLQRQSLAMDERKIVLLEKKAAQADAAARVTGDSKLTPEQKDAEYRRIFGMS